MLKSRKAMEAHLLALLGISLVMTIVLLSTINLVYEPDKEECQKVNFEIASSCKERINAELKIKNLGTSAIKMEINGKTSPNYIVSQSSDKIINVPTLGKDNIEIIPLVTVDSATFQCRGIVENLDLNTLLKC